MRHFKKSNTSLWDKIGSLSPDSDISIFYFPFLYILYLPVWFGEETEKGTGTEKTGDGQEKGRRRKGKGEKSKW